MRNAKEKKIDIEPTINFFKQLWGKFVIYVIATSIIGLFIASFIMKEEITLAKMNEWVSLVLGLVALIIGIISLFLSFYNVDQAYKTQEENIKKMTELQRLVEQKVNSINMNMQRGFHNMSTTNKKGRNGGKINIKEVNEEVEIKDI